ncbi:MAG TPA: SLBB domain-containing protein [Candidatus Kapabacteria bacterium]|nr:SLBB domain-containing protein [Candidatus Kapabacteria bacterium]
MLMLSLAGTRAHAQLSAYELYSRQFQNQAGVADTATERLLAQRQAIRGGYDAQALEGPVDPSTYVLGPGDGVYLNVYAAHSLDQDLTVTPEGRLLIPRIGQVDVSGYNVVDAEARVNQLLARDYRNPNAKLSLRKLRGVKINLLGEVVMPGVQTATALQRLSEVIDKSGGFKEKSSLRNIEIRDAKGSIRAKADLVKYFSMGDVEANPYIQSGDVIMVPRTRRIVTVNGAVASPGAVEFREGDDLAAIIALARGLQPAALTDSIEIARFIPNNPARAERFYVSYESGKGTKIQEGDVIFIRSIPEYHIPRIVTIAGEVRYPGKYSIELGETRLSDILARSGGILPTGSIDEAAVIRRVGVGSWESEPELIRLERLGAVNRDRMTDDEFNYLEARTRQLSRQVMVVDFQRLLNGDKSQDLVLRDEDSILVPRARGYVSVTGAVNNQGNVTFIDNANYESYINRAGGYSASADRGAVRIINAKTSSYIDPTDDDNYKIGPGDVIVIPNERSNFWKNFETVSAVTAQVITIVAGVLLLVNR